MPVKGVKTMKNQALFKLHFDGPSIKEGGILWQDLAQFLSNIDSAIQRIINVMETGTSIRVGRPTKAFQSIAPLEIVAVEASSFVLGIALRRDQDMFPELDLGLLAFGKLLGGLDRLRCDGEDVLLPDGFDQGVLTALREAGRILDHGVDSVGISPALHLAIKQATYDKATRERIVARIRRIEQTLVIAEGRLLMADFKEDAQRCRLHPSTGEAILCSFDDDIASTVWGNLRRFVQVRGDAKIDTATNKIRLIAIRDLEPIDEPSAVSVSILPSSAFWQPKGFDELAAEQGVYPVGDWQRLVGGWPEDTDFDAFLEAIHSARHNTETR